MDRADGFALVKAATGGQVQDGPFSGTIILPETSWGDGELGAKWLGVYEEELHSCLDDLAQRPPSAVINIGCGDGFYAIGLARMFPGVTIFAFDIDGNAQALTRRNVDANSVGGQVSVGGICTPADLIGLAGQYRDCLVVCDIEGGEVELFSASGVVAALGQSDIIIECHDFVVRGTTEKLCQIFDATHDVFVLIEGGRDLSRFSFLSPLSDAERQALVNENRPEIMSWVYARARRPGTHTVDALPASRFGHHAERYRARSQLKTITLVQSGLLSSPITIEDTRRTFRPDFAVSPSAAMKAGHIRRAAAGQVGPKRQAIVTYHGTAVVFDAASGLLRHAVIGTCDVNVHARRSGHEITLTWQDGDAERPLGDFGPTFCALSPDGHVSRLTAIPAGPDLVALFADGRFLCAEPDGVMAMSRSTAELWEGFLLVDLADVANIEFIVTNRWLSQLTGALIEPPEVRCVPGHVIEIGRSRLPITKMIEATKVPGRHGAPPLELVLISDGWKLERYALYRPLIYLVAYAKEEIFRCAEIAIRSLFTFGQWDSDVLLITDAAHLDFADRLPEAIRARVMVRNIPAHDVLDYTMARYKIAAIAEAELYQPIIYMDSDIVCDAPLQSLCRLVALSTHFEVCCENALLDAHDIYGVSLLQTDGINVDPQRPGLSSGIFAFQNVGQHRTLFDAIVSMAYGFVTTSGPRNAFAMYDQPFFNYVLYKMNHPLGTILAEWVHIYFHGQEPIGSRVGKGFVHFAGGVGIATPKLEHMTNYEKLLAMTPAT
jgi:hypothetical protein